MHIVQFKKELHFYEYQKHFAKVPYEWFENYYICSDVLYKIKYLKKMFWSQTTQKKFFFK